MKNTIQDVWDRYEAWQRRYRRQCYQIIDEMMEQDYADIFDALFLQRPDELYEDLINDCRLTGEQLKKRVNNKVNFIRGYLVDISFDGPEYMDKCSRFLSCQYPSRCDNAMALWFEQYLEKVPLEPGSYHGFQEFEAQIFCKKIVDVDLASMRSVLPFDTLHARLPKGERWTKETSNKFVSEIRSDLEFDEEQFEVDLTGYDGAEILTLGFRWSQAQS